MCVHSQTVVGNIDSDNLPPTPNEFLGQFLRLSHGRRVFGEGGLVTF